MIIYFSKSFFSPREVINVSGSKGFLCSAKPCPPFITLAVAELIALNLGFRDKRNIPFLRERFNYGHYWVFII